MSKPFVARPYQRLMVDHVIKTPRCALWADMGMGKTAATLVALDRLSLVEDVYPVLAIATLRVARDTWVDEAAKWDELKHLRVSAVIGDEASRGAALRADADIYCINYDNLQWLGDTLGDRWPFKTVIADESTKLKGFRLRQGTKRARVLAQRAHSKTNRFIELTGTPSPNGLKDLWGQAWFLDAGQRLGRTYDAFRQRWFQKSFDGYGMEPLPFAQEQIQDKLRDVCLALNPADWFPVEKPVVETIHVDLPPKARALYSDMERKMFAEIEGHEVEAFNAAAKTNKCLQLANGAAYVGEGSAEWVEVHNAKIEALESIIDEAGGMPVLVAYNFKSDRARLLKHFKGSVDLATREGLAAFKAGKALVGIGHPASIGHGIDGLQYVTNKIAFFGSDWNLETHDQIIGRIGPVRQMQAGFKRPVFVYYITARNTVDELVMARRTTKREVQDLLLEAVKARRVAA